MNVEQTLIVLTASILTPVPTPPPKAMPPSCEKVQKQGFSRNFRIILQIFCNTVTVFLLKVGEVKIEISQLGQNLLTFI